MTAAPVWQTCVFLCASVSAIILMALFQPGLTTQIWLLAPFVALLGLPHGALDLSIAETLWPVHGWRGKLRFVIFYLGLSALVLGVWIIAPGLSLLGTSIFDCFRDHVAGDAA
jgi:hypothetical protein